MKLHAPSFGSYDRHQILEIIKGAEGFHYQTRNLAVAF